MAPSWIGQAVLGLAPLHSIHHHTINLAIPSEVPSNASGPIDLSYPGFAFEQSSFYNFSIGSDGNPNTFSENLVNEVFKRTGGTPILRVGGTSGDMSSYVPSQEYPTNRRATHGGPAFGRPYLTLGPSYFKAFENFPGAQYMFMVPLAHRHLRNTLQFARQGLKAIGPDRLQSLEIGNEADIYPWFNLNDYVEEFKFFQQALTNEFPEQLGGDEPIFQAIDAASAGTGRLPVSAALKAGLNSTGRISQVAYHLYQRVDNADAGLPYLQRRIANHTAIVKRMSVFEPEIKALKEMAPCARFLLNENGNTLGRLNTGHRNILATALWNVDSQLQGMVIGVDRVNNQQIVIPGYQMWEPVQSEFSPPLVRANYYSQPLVAEFIGTSGDTRVAEMAIPGTDLLSAYVAYDKGRPARIVIVNLELWTPANGTRPIAEVALSGLPAAIGSAKIHRLVAPEGAYASNTLTYRGLQWTYESNGLAVQVKEDSESANLTDGRLSVSIEATSTVLLELELLVL